MAHKDKPALMSQEQFEMLTLAYTAVRKKKGSMPDAPAKDVADVLEALRISGYVVVPRGLVDSFKRILGKVI